MPKFCPLGSGSKGNCLYLETAKTKILIDAGLSTKQTKLRLEQIGVDIDEIDAILMSHEHHDHIQGLRVMAFKMGIPIFANRETAKAIARTYNNTPNFTLFTTGETFQYEDLVIHPFTIQHDAQDPVAFTIETGHQKLGICTDLGVATTLVESHLKKCHTLYIESNHEPTMVLASMRPSAYKERVLGRSGHLSNAECTELIKNVSHKDLDSIYLAHLSGECNTHDIALKSAMGGVEKMDLNPKITVALQEAPSLHTEW